MMSLWSWDCPPFHLFLTLRHPAARSLKTKRTKKFVKLGQFFFISYMTLLYLLIKVFPNFDQLTATAMALCADLGPKCQNLFCLV